jgi:O-antigen ligase
MVLAVAVPLGALALVTARPRRAAGAVAAAVLLILVGSIVASGSRGALAGAFAGLALFAGLAPAEVRTRVAAVAAIAVLFAVAVAITRIPDPARASTASAVSPVETSAARPRHGFLDANVVWRLQDEVGKPPYGSADTTKRPRTLFGTSGRAQAWQGTLDLAGERPLLGFGFGTEDRAFVDRYSGFNSNVPENSYLGLFLQLGAIGLTALALLVGAVLIRLRTLSSLAREQRLVAAAATAALVAGLAVGLFQSFLTSVGNNATAAVWICAFLALAATTPPDVVRSSS